MDFVTNNVESNSFRRSRWFQIGRAVNTDPLADRALADARPAVFWLDRPDRPDPSPALSSDLDADLVVVGGGFTGLWTALCAVEGDPGRSVVVLEAEATAVGASGRNGGFCDASLTHGLENGLAHWPDEVRTLVRLGDENLVGLLDTVERHAIDCTPEHTGELNVAVTPWQVEGLTESAAAHRDHGMEATLLDAAQTRAQVDSPTYLAGLWRRDGVVLVDPARLAWGLRSAAEGLGVRFFDRSPVRSLRTETDGDHPAVRIRTDGGSVVADRAVVATNAFRSPVRQISRSVVPVYDHVLVTEPLSEAQRASVGWSGRQGLSDVGNQFHYYRLTPDDRILWGGWDALYHFGNRVGPALEQSPATSRTLARHFFETFPQLRGLRFTHRWGGPIATTSRFTCAWGTSHGGRVAWAAGYTGLGVGASRFGARVALDLIDGQETERTGLAMVRRSPFPFPPEPLRWVAIQTTRRALQRSDQRGGRRGTWLSLLDRFGIGFDS